MSWTDERVKTLERMWTEGASASQIAKELGGVTRNAVIGKVHRLGLSNRGAEPPAAEAPAAAPSPAAPPAETKAAPAAEVEAPVAEATEQAKPAVAPDPPPPVVAPRRPIFTAGQPLPPQPSPNEINPEALATMREVEKTALKLSLMELTERTCKWPIGDPATDDFWFCGLPVQPGKPYCEAHANVACQPMSARRDRRR
jgi:GcrA cell cycle regulator